LKGVFDRQDRQQKIMITRVRIKGILSDLMEATNLERMPVPLIVFVAFICKPGNHMPDNFLTQFDLNRIRLDNYGAI
jgi:hypothetical protein